MLYVSPKACGQADLDFSSSIESERPKSSLTEASAPLAPIEKDSEEVFPRYSQRELRAKPCCGSLEVASWEEDGAPKSWGESVRE